MNDIKQSIYARDDYNVDSIIVWSIMAPKSMATGGGEKMVQRIFMLARRRVASRYEKGQKDDVV